MDEAFLCGLFRRPELKANFVQPSLKCHAIFVNNAYQALVCQCGPAIEHDENAVVEAAHLVEQDRIPSGSVGRINVCKTPNNPSLRGREAVGQLAEERLLETTY